MHRRLGSAVGCYLAVAAVGCGSTQNASTGAPQTDGGSADAGPVGGSDGGPAVNECDRLGADQNASSIAIIAPTEACGLAAISDYSGNVALSNSSDQLASRNWATYDRTGSRLGTLHSYAPVIPRGSGFFGVDFWNSADPPTDAFHLWTFAPDGSGPSQSVGGFLCRATIHGTSAGGVLVISYCGSGIRSASRVIWFDDTGAQRWSTFINAFPPDGATGDSAGNVLVTAASDAVMGRAGGDLLARWMAPDGSFADDWFVIVRGNAAPAVLQSLIGGGVAVMQDGKWTAVVPPLAAAMAPPDWLASRADRDFRIIRGGKAYAFTFRIVNEPRGSSVEVVAPSGLSCGAFDTNGYAATVGGDGTVIANIDACTRKVWPGLLGARQ